MKFDVPADTPPSTTTDDAWPDAPPPRPRSPCAPLTDAALRRARRRPARRPLCRHRHRFRHRQPAPGSPPRHRVRQYRRARRTRRRRRPRRSSAGPAVAPFETPPFQTDWPSAADLDLKAAPAEPVDFDALLVKQDDDPTPPEALAATPGDQPWPASEEPAAMLAQAQAEAPIAPIEIDTTADAPKVVAETVETVESYEDADDEPTIEPEPEPAPPPMLRQAAWTAGATLLASPCSPRARWCSAARSSSPAPQTRPLMESLCAGLGCDLPLPRDAR